MSLFDERVEAGARVLRERLFPGVDLSLSGDSAWVGHVREILQAADAVVTEEMIAEVIAGHPIGSGFYQTTVGVGEAREMAEAIRALFGEVAGNE